MIGERLKEQRNKNGLTLKQMGEILGVSHMTYQRYEKNDTDVSTDMLIKLADFYGVTTDYLLGRDPNPLSNIRLDIIGTDDEAFSAAYKNLPDYAKLIFMDALKKLAEAGSREREYMTYETTCGELEDAAREKDDISAG